MKLKTLSTKHRKDKWGRRWRRHMRIRKSVVGTSERPRLLTRKTQKHIYVMAIDDSPEGGAHTVCSASTSKPGAEKNKGFCNIENAKKVGAEIAARLSEKGIKSVAFDRGGYRYHGCVKALADTIREAGIKI